MIYKILLVHHHLVDVVVLITTTLLLYYTEIQVLAVGLGARPNTLSNVSHVVVLITATLLLYYHCITTVLHRDTGIGCWVGSQDLVEASKKKGLLLLTLLTLLILLILLTYYRIYIID
jgi:hypothetical protein